MRGPSSRRQKTSPASERPAQAPAIVEAEVARKTLDLQNEPARPAVLCALEPVEVGVPSELAIAWAAPIVDAATALHARPPFRARTGDAR